MQAAAGVFSRPRSAIAAQLRMLGACAACREEISWSLQTLNANALELNRLWHEHGYASAVRLLDVSSVDLLDRLPVKVRGERQLGHRHGVAMSLTAAHARAAAAGTQGAGKRCRADLCHRLAGPVCLLLFAVPSRFRAVPMVQAAPAVNGGAGQGAAVEPLAAQVH